MKVFEAKCMRCESLLKIDFEKRFGELKTDADLESAKRFVYQTGKLIEMCPKCKKNTYFVSVSPIEGTEVSKLIKAPNNPIISPLHKK